MKLHIRLGPQRFAAEREGLSMLGTVQRGLQIGALARNLDGEYLQVNGDITQPLNKSRVELALQKSGGLAAKPKAVAGPPAVAPTVIVKPRRRIAMLPDAMAASVAPPGNAPAVADMQASAPSAVRAAPVVSAAPAEGRRPPLVLRRKIST